MGQSLVGVMVYRKRILYYLTGIPNGRTESTPHSSCPRFVYLVAEVDVLDWAIIFFSFASVFVGIAVIADIFEIIL
jgi:hypothetical protein